eukprot:CAMPEP_0170814594 /NCGR_PEP_ID=MMETSP0733-20121128/37775_1 /TAXON_ID=186038 /ORGANISM="Fragilariopsis kerguelensis, Strain L26-C5" /LENGTH=35 /DNA_ID= /DNA_START= /DNA_END= /DNA_ORIENTATION=
MVPITIRFNKIFGSHATDIADCLDKEEDYYYENMD